MSTGRLIGTLLHEQVDNVSGFRSMWSAGQWRLITGGNGKFLPGPAVIRTRGALRQDFPSETKSSFSGQK